jgi:cyclin-dependent kinase regulatory subunit CKS1
VRPFLSLLNHKFHTYCYGGRIHYSDKYSDDEYEYRHVILPKPLLKLIPKAFFSPDDSGTLRILSETEWRGIGITQSLGWQHYEVHGRLILVFNIKM